MIIWGKRRTNTDALAPRRRQTLQKNVKSREGVILNGRRKEKADHFFIFFELRSLKSVVFLQILVLFSCSMEVALYRTPKHTGSRDNLGCLVPTFDVFSCGIMCISDHLGIFRWLRFRWKRRNGFRTGAHLLKQRESASWPHTPSRSMVAQDAALQKTEEPSHAFPSPVKGPGSRGPGWPRASEASRGLRVWVKWDVIHV